MAFFGPKDTSDPLYCSFHKNADDVDVLHKRCKKCDIISMRYKDLCSMCDPNARKKLKEIEVYEKFDEHFHKQFSYNNAIGNYIPDFLFKCNKHYIVCEVDEYEHKRGYDKNEEIKRMKDIQKDLKLPTIFIRFNPDNFCKNDIKIKSKTDKHDILVSLMKEALNDSDIKESMIYKLFYDCDCKDNCNYLHKSNLY